MFQGRQKSCFLVFLFLVCFVIYRLLWKDLGELVSVMERDLGYSMETFYELCESQLRKGIGEEISGE
jgi:flagellar biosynthesis protein FlhB